ncbi:hypothetical protein Ac2012v2_003504, partial [Leucoagaricus gongylophorus]
MSLLASLSGRAFARTVVAITSTNVASSPVSSLGAGVTIYLESKRYVSRRRAKERDAKKNTIIQRDVTGKPIVPTKERPPPLFTWLPPDSLHDPIFEVTTSEEPEFPVFSTDTVSQDHLGKAMQFSAAVNPQAARKEFGLPKSIWKDFQLLSHPASVIRGVTLDLVNYLNQVQKEHLSSEEARLVFSGRIGSGKSYVLYQAVEWCLTTGWIVLYIPRAANFVNSSTPYTYDLRTQTYFQPNAACHILHRVRSVNAQKFKNLKLQKTLDLGEGYKPAQPGTSLYEFCDVSKEEVAKAPVVLDLLTKELGEQTVYPVLLAVDDFQVLFNKSFYRDPHFKPISSYHLSVPRLLLSLFSPSLRSFSYGAVLGAVTSSDPAFPISLELKDMLDITDQANRPVVEEEYVKRSEALKEYLEGVVSVEVPNQLSVQEAAGLFEIWMKQRALASSLHDEMFMSNKELHNRNWDLVESKA